MDDFFAVSITKDRRDLRGSHADKLPDLLAAVVCHTDGNRLTVRRDDPHRFAPVEVACRPGDANWQQARAIGTQFFDCARIDVDLALRLLRE